MRKKKFSTVEIVEVSGENSLEKEVGPEIIDRFIHKDSEYLKYLIKDKGPEYTLSVLDKIARSADLSTKYGRELIKTKEEIMTRLTYQSRTIEEHQNVSIHISESDLYKVYREHLKVLHSRTEKVRALANKSSPDNILLYEYNSPLLKSRYLLSPLFWTLIPFNLVIFNQAAIILALGSLAPSFLLLSSVFLGLKRYQWLTRGDRLNGSTLVSFLYLKGDQIEISTFLSFKKKTFDRRNISIQRIDNAARTEVFYLIKDNVSKSKFIMPLDERASANQKLLDWFNNLGDDPYSITKVLLKGEDKVIDLERFKHIKKEIDIVARINILKTTGFPIETLSARNLYELLYSIPDKNVSEYLDSVRSRLNSKI